MQGEEECTLLRTNIYFAGVAVRSIFGIDGAQVCMGRLGRTLMPTVSDPAPPVCQRHQALQCQCVRHIFVDFRSSRILGVYILRVRFSLPDLAWQHCPRNLYNWPCNCKPVWECRKGSNLIEASWDNLGCLSTAFRFRRMTHSTGPDSSETTIDYRHSFWKIVMSQVITLKLTTTLSLKECGQWSAIQDFRMGDNGNFTLGLVCRWASRSTSWCKATQAVPGDTASIGLRSLGCRVQWFLSPWHHTETICYTQKHLSLYILSFQANACRFSDRYCISGILSFWGLGSAILCLFDLRWPTHFGGQGSVLLFARLKSA